MDDYAAELAAEAAAEVDGCDCLELFGFFYVLLRDVLKDLEPQWLVSRVVQQ